MTGGALSAQAVDRILADTRNNPLALTELGTQYTAGQLSGRAALPEPLPLGQRLQEHFLRQVRSLPPDAQTFALLAAADPEGERGRLWHAAAQAGIDPDVASAETAEAGMLEFPGNSVRFRYPLLRSAVYHGASAVDRRQAHRAWSEVGGSELRVWHLAAAAIVPDEELAADLQHTAERAATRGGYAARAALLRRSADLTPDDARRAQREVALAEARLMAGDQVGAQKPFRAAVAALLADDLDPAVGLRWFGLGAAAAGSLWDDQATLDLSDRWVKTARAAGALTTLPVALAFNAVSESMAGHFREAGTRWALRREVLTMGSGPGVLGVNSSSDGLLLA